MRCAGGLFWIAIAGATERLEDVAETSRAATFEARVSKLMRFDLKRGANLWLGFGLGVPIADRDTDENPGG